MPVIPSIRHCTNESVSIVTIRRCASASPYRRAWTGTIMSASPYPEGFGMNVYAEPSMRTSSSPVGGDTTKTASGYSPFRTAYCSSAMSAVQCSSKYLPAPASNTPGSAGTHNAVCAMLCVQQTSNAGTHSVVCETLCVQRPGQRRRRDLT